jgi:hypothetical protein
VLQVFENLVGNAIKATPKGGRITIAAAARPGEVLFSVADTGAGIPAADLPHVFDRFWKAKRAERQGAGLGLPSAKASSRPTPVASGSRDLPGADDRLLHPAERTGARRPTRRSLAGVKQRRASGSRETSFLDRRRIAYAGIGLVATALSPALPQQGRVVLGHEAHRGHHEAPLRRVERLVRDVEEQIPRRLAIAVDGVGSTKSQPKRAPTLRTPWQNWQLS